MLANAFLKWNCYWNRNFSQNQLLKRVRSCVNSDLFSTTLNEIVSKVLFSFWRSRNIVYRHFLCSILIVQTYELAGYIRGCRSDLQTFQQNTRYFGSSYGLFCRSFSTLFSKFYNANVIFGLAKKNPIYIIISFSWYQ